MIKQFCDSCESEIVPGVLEGYSEIDKFASDEGQSVHFHIAAVGTLLCSDCFDSLLMNALGLEYIAAPQQEIEQEEDRRVEAEELESKPRNRGQYMGQKSPRGRWRWHGYGLATDDWELIEEPAQKK